MPPVGSWTTHYGRHRVIICASRVTTVPPSTAPPEPRSLELSGRGHAIRLRSQFSAALFLASASASTSDQNSASETVAQTGPSGTRPFLPSGPTSLQKPGSAGTQIANTDLSPSSSVPTQKREPGGALNRAGVIAPTTTPEGADRQPPKITSQNLSSGPAISPDETIVYRIGWANEPGAAGKFVGDADRITGDRNIQGWMARRRRVKFPRVMLGATRAQAARRGEEVEIRLGQWAHGGWTGFTCAGVASLSAGAPHLLNPAVGKPCK